MPLPKSFTTVTPLSRYLAMLLFILFPFIGFFAGMRYQQDLDQVQLVRLNQKTITGEDEKVSAPSTYNILKPSEKITTSPTSIPYKNWNKYTNNKFRYTISYEGSPTKVVVDNLREVPNSRLLDLVTLPYANYQILVAVWKNYHIQITDISSFKEWCKKSAEDFQAPGSTPGVLFNDELSCLAPRDGNTVTQATFLGKTSYELGGWTERTIFIPYHGYIYEVTVKTTGNVSLYEESDKKINFAFSTFKLY